jgi:peptidoglycan/xylan/chitin deacetylase (PgdA/CDA1 family)
MNPNPSSIEVALTVDVEPDCPPYLSTWRGIEEGMPKLLDLFAGENIKATFFTTGETARRFPQAVRAIVDGRHELGSHGVTHRSFVKISDADAAWEISYSLKLLREFGPVTSFRAPYLQFPDRFVSLLEQQEVTRDSSQARYKWQRCDPSAAHHLARIPVSMTSSFLRLPTVVRDPILTRLASPVVLFVHPWEFVDLRKTSLRWDCRFRTGKTALESLRTLIHLFKRKHAVFRTVNEIIVH